MGGAGFASQRTTGDDRSWDLSAYEGIHLEVGKDDGKLYTFVLKDEILPLMDDGREQSTVSYEYDFSAAGSCSVFIPWSELKPTYRGKEKDDAPPLNTKSVKRWSFMMRSFFGSQEGDFSVEIKSVKAVSRPEDPETGFTSEKRESETVEVSLCFEERGEKLTPNRRSPGHGGTPKSSASHSSLGPLGPSARVFAGIRALI